MINLRGNQKWFFCTIRLEEYEAEDIDADSITLQETVEPNWVRMSKGDKILKVRFNMDDIRDLVDDSQKTISLTVQGTLLEDGTPFEGSDTLKVYRKK